jgi:plasmid stabilization system protein ParE
MQDKKNYILSKHAAGKELEKMMDYYEIDIDEIEDKDLKKAITSGYDRLVKAVRLGRLEIKLEEGIQIVQTLRNGEKIKYREIDGIAKTQMAGKDEKDYYGKSYALMGSLSDMGEGAIKQLKGVDLSLAEVLGMIFLSV